MPQQTQQTHHTQRMQTLKDIRQELKSKYSNNDFVIDKTGAKMVEIIGATFIADEESILRDTSHEYVQRELEWYKSQSLYVEDIPGTTPAIWNQVSNTDGMINSNYGWCIFSNENGNQYKNVKRELERSPLSRRASMIYTRPSMHKDFNKDGMSDFMCTYGNSFFIRDNKLHSHYIMRSNDAVFGYNNDYAWALYVQDKLAKDLDVQVGDIIWTASNLHVYERHFEYLK